MNRETREKYEKGKSENLGTVLLRKRKKPRGLFKYKLYEGIEVENRRRKEKEKLEKEISERKKQEKKK